jgi:hypothetical protein
LSTLWVPPEQPSPAYPIEYPIEYGVSTPSSAHVPSYVGGIGTPASSRNVGARSRFIAIAADVLIIAARARIIAVRVQIIAVRVRIIAVRVRIIAVRVRKIAVRVRIIAVRARRIAVDVREHRGGPTSETGRTAQWGRAGGTGVQEYRRDGIKERAGGSDGSEGGWEWDGRAHELGAMRGPRIMSGMRMSVSNGHIFSIGSRICAQNRLL